MTAPQHAQGVRSVTPDSDGQGTAAGATPTDWAAWQRLGLTADLLPVVSDLAVPISQASKLRDLGKTPSYVNGSGCAVGIPCWTTRHSTDTDVQRWAQDSRLGVCLQTRTVRAIDIDIDDPVRAADVVQLVATTAGALPMRTRPNSGKCLLMFRMPGEFRKRVIRTPHGIIEFLATGQQFVAAGTHTTGVRYAWDGGLPTTIPLLAPAEFDARWQGLQDAFGIPGGASTGKAPIALQQARIAADAADPDVARLYEAGQVVGEHADGILDVLCPWQGEHTSDTGPSSTSYLPVGVGGQALAGFRCLHAHCEARTIFDYRRAVGLDDPAGDFDPVDLDEAQAAESAAAAIRNAQQRARFAPMPWHAFTAGRQPQWLVRGVLPQAELAVIYGESGSGKTFFALDLVAAIARGLEWRGRRVQPGRVVYVCAEGVSGFRKRVQAYACVHAIKPDAMRLDVIADAPSLMTDDHKTLAAAIGSAAVVVIDTLAQATPGANENSGEDMGLALAHCKALHRATGALIVLIHHSGKDAARGARGWSGLKGACDAEIEVSRNADARRARVSKQKDGEEGDVFPFKLHPLLLGTDDDGEEITSCTVVAAEPPPPARAEPRGTVQKLVLALAHEMMGTAGSVPEAALIAQAVARLPEPEADKEDRRRFLVKRAIAGLTECAFLCKEGECIAAPL